MKCSMLQVWKGKSGTSKALLERNNNMLLKIVALSNTWLVDGKWVLYMCRVPACPQTKQGNSEWDSCTDSKKAVCSSTTEVCACF